MKRFSFPLQKLLDLREFKEKQAEIALGKAIAEREKIQLELEGIARERVSWSFSRTTGASIQDLLSIERYIARLDAKKEELLEDLAAAEISVEQARLVYLEATRDRQVISKLKEKKTDAWRKDMLKEEAESLDDISNSAFSKNEGKQEPSNT